MTYSAEEKLKSVERELGYRRRVYANLVAGGKMAKSEADKQISVFEEIASDYREQISRERLL